MIATRTSHKRSIRVFDSTGVTYYDYDAGTDTSTWTDNDSPTAASTSGWTDPFDALCDAVADMAVAYVMSSEEIQRMINELKMAEKLDHDWKYQVYKTKVKPIEVVQNIWGICPRRRMFSKSGFKGLKGRRYRS